MKSELMNEILMSKEYLLNKDDENDMDVKWQAQSLNIFGNIKKAD